MICGSSEAQFDFHEYLGKNGAVSYLLDVQSDLLRTLATRIVVPLVPLDVFGLPLQRLNPVLPIASASYVMATADMAGTPLRQLGKIVGSLEPWRLDIKAAIDFLYDGF